MTNQPIQPAQSDNAMAPMPNSWMNGDTLSHLCRVSELMASSKVTVPNHLSGSNGDCLAVCMQAMQWGMNPFAVAQKTHLVQGNLGYEGQLVNAVITAMAPTEDRLEFEFFGPWENVLGKFKFQTSDKGHKYTKQDWTLADEEGIGVKVFATLRGESKPREISILLKQCWPRNSTQWATDPQQQITYVAAKKWARRYCPDVILGVYTPDELETSSVEPEKDITPAKEESKALPNMTDEKFTKNLATWAGWIESGQGTADQVIAKAVTRFTLTEEQINQIRQCEVIDGEVA